MPANRRPRAPGNATRPGRAPSSKGGQSQGRRTSSAGAGASSRENPAPTRGTGPAARKTTRPTRPTPGSSRDTRSPSRSKPAPATREPRSSTAAPARTDRRRSRFGFLLPEVLTVRTLVLSVVILLAVVLLLPTVRAYVNQTGELRDLRGQLATAQTQREELKVQLARWDDKNYVIQQARDRLSFIMPGDTPWRVLDAGTVVDDTNPATGESLTDGPIEDFTAGTPWYQSVWDSVQLAGQRASGQQGSTGDDPTPATSPDTGSSPSGSPSPTSPTPAGDASSSAG